MPIRPEMKDRYPKDWPAIRARILERADGECECSGQCGSDHPQALDGRCGAPNGAVIRRRLDIPAWWSLTSEVFGDELLDHGPEIRVVLTIAHLVDKAPEACSPENLAALCQRCHLKLDAGQHAETARASREARSGQGRLPL